jgi:hypothetical protein
MLSRNLMKFFGIRIEIVQLPMAIAPGIKTPAGGADTQPIEDIRLE